nr:hypothetical protein [Mycoplasmopsis bovis]
MKYINVDISNALELNEINKYHEQVVQIHHNIINQKVNEKDWLGWINLPNNINNLEMKKMIDIANVWKKQKVSTLSSYWHRWFIFRSYSCLWLCFWYL